MPSHSRLLRRLVDADHERDTLARHLLRALLREASYLPDAIASSFAHARIVARFRDFPEYERQKDPWKFDALIKLGGKNLRQLQRANNGEARGLTRVLEHTYGRAGKRRYELMRPLFFEEAGGASEVDKTCSTPIGQIHGHPLPLPAPLDGPFLTKRDTLQFRFSQRFPALRALVHNQSRQSEMLHSYRYIKSASFEMPLKNLWERVQPRKRQANAAKKWYAQTLGQIQPPLPEEEWLHLKGLSTGEIAWTGPQRQRPIAGRILAIPKSSDEAVAVSGSGSANDSHLSTALPPSLLLASEIGVTPIKKQIQLRDGRDVSHEITPRFMRRLYTKILTQCPLMVYDHTESVWKVNWFDPHQSRSESIAEESRTSPDRVLSELEEAFEARTPSIPDMDLLFGNADLITSTPRR